MYIVRSWQKSILLFTPANFISFMSDVGRSLVETYLMVLRYWYLWLLPMVAWIYKDILSPWMYSAYYSHELTKKIFAIGAYPVALLTVVWLLMFLCLAARQTSEPKSLLYFRSHLVHFCKFSSVMLISSVALYTILSAFDYSYLAYLILLEAIFAGIPTAAYLLFYLDSNGSYKELGRSAVKTCKLIVYNLPSIFMLFGGTQLALIFIRTFVYKPQSQLIIDIIVFGVLWPFIIALWVNLYKRNAQDKID